MRTLFALFLIVLVGCEDLYDQSQSTKEELVIVECQEERTRCDPRKEFVYRCLDGYWEPWTDCYEQDMVCFLYDGAARCKSDQTEIVE